jgi:transposase
MGSSTSRTTVSTEQRLVLERWVAAQGIPQSVAMRARIVLMAAAGESNSEIARRLAVSRPTVIMWRQRFAAGGLSALTEVRPGRGRKPTISAAKVKAIVAATTQSLPPGQTHWSCRSMARAQGVSAATVQRIWDVHGLKPHRTRSFNSNSTEIKRRDLLGGLIHEYYPVAA